MKVEKRYVYEFHIDFTLGLLKSSVDFSLNTNFGFEFERSTNILFCLIFFNTGTAYLDIYYLVLCTVFIYLDANTKMNPFICEAKSDTLRQFFIHIHQFMIAMSWIFNSDFTFTF